MLVVENKTDRKIVHVDILYHEFYLCLVAFAKDLVKRQDVAEDVVQELFVGLLSKDLTFPTEASLRSYLFVSVKNRSFDYLKHQEIEERYVNTSFMTNSPQYDEWENSFDEELMNLLFAEIDRLPERCREIFLLSLDGLSNEEIAVRCHISVETVKTQKKRAKKIIKEHLADKKDGNSALLLLFLKIMYPF